MAALYQHRVVDVLEALAGWSKIQLGDDTKWVDDLDLSPVTLFSKPLPTVQLVSSPALGEFLITSTNRVQGERILQSHPTLYILSTSNQKRYCQACWNPLHRKALRCQDCLQVLYCSSKCFQGDSAHDLQCQALHHLSQLPPLPTEKQDLVRLALTCMTQPETLQHLVPHPNPHPDVIQRLHRLVPGPRKEIAHIVACLQANAFPMETGLALVPLAAKMNHSCSPTTWMERQGNVLVWRTTKTLEKGMTLSFGYLGQWYQPREERRALLRQGFGFDCCCVRCSVELTHSIDRELEEMICPHCHQMSWNAAISGFQCNRCGKRNTVAWELRQKMVQGADLMGMEKEMGQLHEMHYVKEMWWEARLHRVLTGQPKAVGVALVALQRLWARFLYHGDPELPKDVPWNHQWIVLMQRLGRQFPADRQVRAVLDLIGREDAVAV